MIHWGGLCLFLGLFGVVLAGNCVQNPTNDNCTNYHYPYASQDVGKLCSMMPNMPGCTIDRLCKGTKDIAGSKYCDSFSVLKDICVADMPKMSGCKNYTSMCGVGSVVLQCDTAYLPIPTSAQTAQLISQICEEMKMEPCSKCQHGGQDMDCDLLSVYSELCLSMPDMDECSQWKQYCEDIPTWPLCTNAGPDHGHHPTPMMRMYFHWGFVDYVLFKGWVPTDAGTYAATVIAVFVAGLLGEVIKMIRAILEKRWASKKKKHGLLNAEKEEEEKCDECEETWAEFLSNYFRVPFYFHRELIRGVLQFVEVAWSLLLMLVAMTFNAGLFLAVCGGAAVGSFLFGRYLALSRKAAQKQSHHH